MDQIKIRSKTDLLFFFKSASFDDVENTLLYLFSQIKEYHDFYFPAFKVFGLFRGRIHSHLNGNLHGEEFEEFTYQSQHWEAPCSKVRDYGRCNNIGESLLYCSNSLNTAILECQPQKGKFITISSYESNYNIDSDGEIIHLDLAIVGKKYLSDIPELNRMFKRFRDANIPEETMAFFDFLDDLFHEDSRTSYKVSAVVSKCLINSVYTKRNLQTRGGMMYPSIVRDKKSFNIVLKSDYAKKIMHLKKLQTFHILDSDENIVKLKLVRAGLRYPSHIKDVDPNLVLWMDTPLGKEITINRKTGSIARGI